MDLTGLAAAFKAVSDHADLGSLPPDARAILAVALARPEPEARPIVSRDGKPHRPLKTGDPLVKALAKWRAETARTTRRKMYHVLINRTIQQIADERPRTIDELSKISGMGPYKIETYGRDILRIVAEHNGSPSVAPAETEEVSGTPGTDTFSYGGFRGWGATKLHQQDCIGKLAKHLKAAGDWKVDEEVLEDFGILPATRDKLLEQRLLRKLKAGGYRLMGES